MRTAFCLNGRLTQRFMATRERAEKLIVQVITISENDNRRILETGIKRQPSGVEDHRQTLTRSLRMPHHASAFVSISACRVNCRLDGMTHGVELVISGDLLDGPRLLLFKNDE